MRASVLIFTLFVFTLNGQTPLTGTIKSADSKEALAYVNIGILGKGVGTVSNEEGMFSVSIADRYDNDSLKISMVGYESKTFLVQDFIDRMERENTIYLSEKVVVLNEVVVTNRKLKTRTLGNRTTSKLISDGFDSDQLGNEAGLVIKIKRNPTYIQSFHASIAKNGHKELKFRLNFYNLRNGLPHENILKENIIVTSTIESGVLSVDLREYDIVMEEDFFVSLEWIEDFGEGDLRFSIGFFGSPVIYREASQGHWTIINAIGPGFTVKVKH